VDRVTWRDYQRNLETNLEDLHERLKNRTYVPQPVQRKWILCSDNYFSRRATIRNPCAVGRRAVSHSILDFSARVVDSIGSQI